MKDASTGSQYRKRRGLLIKRPRLFLPRGSSTLEILIAFAVLALAFTAVISVVFGNQSVSADTQANDEAIARAQNLLERERALARGDFSSVAPIGTQADGQYQKSVDVQSIDQYTKLVTSNVLWNQAGRNLAVHFSTILTDAASALGGDTCAQTLAGDWSNPQLLGTADVGQNNGGTDVDVLHGKAYVTTNASAQNKPDFYIVDVSNPNLSNLPILNGSGLNTGPGLAAVRVAGTYAYVANLSTLSQLQVIDISAPAAPAVVASLRVTPAGGAATGNSVFYLNKKVYLGLDSPSAGPEFFVIDVSDPLHPAKIASFETGTKVSKILVRGAVAYLAVPDDPSTSGAEQMRVLDVSQADAGIITQIAVFRASPSTMSGEGLYLSQDGQTLYLGEGGANSGHKPDFYVLDVSNPSAPAVLQSKYIPTSGNVTVNAVRVRANLAFLSTSDTNLGFQIWDLNNLGAASPYASINTQQTASNGMDCEGNYLYTAQKSQKALQIIGPS